MSQDCTITNAGVITCTKTNNVAFATVATSGSASDLGTGTLPNARIVALPNANLANSTITISGKSTALGASYAPARASMTPTNPTGTTNLTGVMSGLAGSFTPAANGAMYFSATMITQNNTANDGCSVQFRYGTGAAPANGAALTGTTVGQAMITSGSAAQLLPVPLVAYVAGFTPGTTYWLDLSEAAVTGGTCSVSQITMIALEQ